MRNECRGKRHGDYNQAGHRKRELDLERETALLAFLPRLGIGVTQDLGKRIRKFFPDWSLVGLLVETARDDPA
jgi:hypothetical protein